jgi:hypothetical protein
MSIPTKFKTNRQPVIINKMIEPESMKCCILQLQGVSIRSIKNNKVTYWQRKPSCFCHVIQKKGVYLF